jgi:DNA polymerase elongation subunit (family B)
MTTKDIFIYKWDMIEEDGTTKLVGFGLDDANETNAILVDNFEPYCYVSAGFEQKGTAYLNRCKEHILRALHGIKPTKVEYVIKRKLYHADMTPTFEYKTYGFLKYSFTSYMHVKKLASICNFPQRVFGFGEVEFRCHEHKANPVLQLCCIRDIKPSGWVSIKGTPLDGDDHFSTCKHDYRVSYRKLKGVDTMRMPSPMILSFDLEVYSRDPNKMPSAENPSDKIFQISCVFQRQGAPETMKRILLSMGKPNQSITGEDVEIRAFSSELAMLRGFVEILQEYKPHIAIGYNIFGFDIPYLIYRYRNTYGIEKELLKIGFIDGYLSNIKQIKWSSSAYKNQEFEYVDAHGIIFMDMDPYIRRDYKFDNYKLKTVSSFFLGETKDPLTPKGIFKCFEKHTPKALGIVGKYCIQDAVLVLKLFEHLKTWYALCEMSATFNVSIPTLYTQGQQIKVFSQIYKYCFTNDIVVEDPKQTETTDKYQGAYVFDPVPGLYDMVVSFDFSSLYPTTIIAYNIDYSTLVLDESIPDEKCHIFDWEEHQLCEHDTKKYKIKPKETICKHYHFRFLKEPKGVLPTILQNLLDARKRVNRQIDANKARMKEYPEEHDTLENENTILDKRQLSYKVSANSMYGAMGVKRGYLPFMTGAMCTTARGRQSIEKAANFIQSTYQGKLIYGDTDSTYVTFPHITDPLELWNFCKKVEEEIMSLFPRPMKLAFEEKIYWRYFILTKKRYMALSCDTKGKVSDKIFKRGVLLARRDNSKWIREAYQDIIMKVFYRMPYDELEKIVIDCMYQLFTRVVDAKQFIITKSVGNIEDYKIKALPDDPVKRAKRLKELGCATEDEYIAKALPSQAQLAEKMRRRGKPVSAGSRIEYVIINNGVIEDKLFNKIEDADYFLDHTSVLSIDPMYYLKLACNPLDQVIEVAYGKKDFCLTLYKYLKQKHKVIQQLKGLYTPNLSFE